MTVEYVRQQLKQQAEVLHNLIKELGDQEPTQTRLEWSVMCLEIIRTHLSMQQDALQNILKRRGDA